MRQRECWSDDFVNLNIVIGVKDANDKKMMTRFSLTFTITMPTRNPFVANNNACKEKFTSL